MDHLAFLATCGTTITASPPEAHGIMVTPFHLLLGNALMSALLSIPPGVFPLQQEPAWQIPPASSHQSAWALASVQAATQLAPDQVQPPSPLQSTSKVTPKESPHSKWKEEMPLHKDLSRSHQEAFRRDSKLVQKAREEYYWENCPHASTMKLPVTWQTFSRAWLNLPAY